MKEILTSTTFYLEKKILLIPLILNPTTAMMEKEILTIFTFHI